jgi:hypothetical protein
MYLKLEHETLTRFLTTLPPDDPSNFDEWLAVHYFLILMSSGFTTIRSPMYSLKLESEAACAALPLSDSPGDLVRMFARNAAAKMIHVATRYIYDAVRYGVEFWGPLYSTCLMEPSGLSTAFTDWCTVDASNLSPLGTTDRRLTYVFTQVENIIIAYKRIILMANPTMNDLSRENLRISDLDFNSYWATEITQLPQRILLGQQLISETKQLFNYDDSW